MNRNLRIALMAFLIAGAISFVLSFTVTALGAPAAAPMMGMIGALLGFIVVMIFWNLSGNRKVAAADPAQRAQALTFTPREGQALIYLIRTGFVAKAAGMNISVDGMNATQLRSPQFTCLEVAPGTHEIVAAFAGGAGAQSNPQALSLTVQAGEAVALRFTIKLGGTKNAIAIEPISAQDAKPLVAGMKMVAPHAA